MISAIIVAAGSSRRMGFDKLFADLGGQPVVAHSIAAFLDHPEIGEVVVVGTEGNRERLSALTEGIRVVMGGSERHFSVANGLEAISDGAEIVAVHDGARPLIHPDTISATLRAAREQGAAACARRITDTVKRANPDGQVIAGVDREHLWAMETPQCFQVPLLREAYRQVLDAKETVTDEVSAVERLGKPVFLVENPHPNPKITFPADLEFAARLLR